MQDQNHIILSEVNETNLKNISLEIPKKKITIFTGVSGAGKSSIVFDTISKVQASPHKELTEQMLRHHIKRTFNWHAFEMIWPNPPAAERLAKLTVKTLFIIGTEELPDNLRVADYF